MKPNVTNTRRELGEVETKTYNISLPIDTVEILEKYGVKSARGNGNLSVFLEMSSMIAIGLFDNPEMATHYLLSLMDNPYSMDLYKLCENLEETSKRLFDIMEPQ